MEGIHTLNTGKYPDIDQSIWHKLLKDFGCPIHHIDQETTVRVLDQAAHHGIGEGTTLISKWALYLAPLTPAERTLFMEDVRKSTDLLVQIIQTLPSYPLLQDADINKALPLYPVQASKNLYTPENIGKRFISIDLKEAAFTALKTWNNMNVGEDISRMNCTYAEFVRRHIEGPVAEYLIDSKRLRQVIFGHTSPKRLMHIEYWQIQSIAKVISTERGLIPICMNNDEVIYEYTPQLWSWLKCIYDPDIHHITEFTLEAWHLLQEGHPGRNTSTPPFCYTGDNIYVKTGTAWNGFGETLDVTLTPYTSFKKVGARFRIPFALLYNNPGNAEAISAALSILDLPEFVDGYYRWNTVPGVTWRIEKI